jgi:hypothetical protein
MSRRESSFVNCKATLEVTSSDLAGLGWQLSHNPVSRELDVRAERPRIRQADLRPSDEERVKL